MTDNTEPTQPLSTTLKIYEKGVVPVSNFYVKFARRNEVYELSLIENQHGSGIDTYSLRRGDDVQARTPDRNLVKIFHDATAIPPTGLGKLYAVLKDGTTVAINY